MAVVSATVNYARSEIDYHYQNGARMITRYTGYATMMGGMSAAEELAEAINQLRQSNIPVYVRDFTEEKSN